MSTATAELCGHRWLRVRTSHDGQPLYHRCDVPAGHHLDTPIPRPCACRCGATTTRPTEGD